MSYKENHYHVTQVRNEQTDYQHGFESGLANAPKLPRVSLEYIQGYSHGRTARQSRLNVSDLTSGELNSLLEREHS